MKITEETGLSTVDTETGEISPTSGAAAAQSEIQSAIIIAKRMPRSEDQAFSKLMRSCQRPTFANDVSYSFPRGEATVTGPSVHLAREAARIWGNFRYGCDILTDGEESRVIQGWAWDMETNTKVTSDDAFKKLIFRKKTGWTKPDERDLRELTNRRGAILVRNCILQLLPKDLVEDALYQATKTITEKASKDPDAAKKRLLADFASVNVTAEMLAVRLGHSLSECTPENIAELQGIYKSIADGNSTWREYAADTGADKETPPPPGAISMDDLKEGVFEKPKEEKKARAPKGKGGVISIGKKRELLTKATEYGWKPLEVAALLSKYGYTRMEDILVANVDKIEDQLEGGANDRE